MAGYHGYGQGNVVETKIPARLDRLPWARWHWLVVFALGSVWILDGLEVTIVGAVAGQLQDPQTLGLSPSQLGLIGSVYVAGAVSGAIGFGYLTDRFGRKKLFLVTLGLYLVATTLTAFSWDFYTFAICRFFTGAGIGGEYSAINSAIDEMIPARVRGTVDLAINGSYWLGTAVGAIASIYLLNTSNFAIDVGWRIGFGIGATLALGILLVRRFLPESPRWLMTHGRADEAEEIVSDIEERVDRETDEPLEEPEESIEVRQRTNVGFGEVIKAVFREHRRRSVLGFMLMMSQAFLYNAIFFTYALILTDFYSVPADRIGWYLLPFAIGNFLGPLLLGRFFDTVGRRIMISGTYIISGLLLAISGWMFNDGHLDATTQTFCWIVIFFFASAGASAAYLTVSETWPIEIRAEAIAVFFAIAQIFGAFGPVFYGWLIGDGSDTTGLFIGYVIGGAIMVLGGIVELAIGIKAEGKSLEEITKPITATDQPAAAAVT